VAYGAGRVSASALNVRDSAGTAGSVIATLYKDEYVVILDGAGSDWYRINHDGTVGYVAAMYITGVETAKNFNATGVLNGSGIRMRATPSTAGAVLGVYGTGTAMQVIGINSGWYKVKYDGKTGYIRSDLMDITAGAGASSTSASITASSVAPLAAASDTGRKIAEFAYQYIGYPYVYGAASPAVGFDCSGLVYYVYSRFGYALSRSASQQYRNNGVSVSKDQLRPGDLVFFSSNGGRSVTHVGLYYGDGMFVNASTSKTGVIFSSLNSSYYQKTYYGAKRIVS
jgi:cell wall-associated NlpC family hydrolase